MTKPTTELLTTERPSDLAMKIAVQMEIHAALSTTTQAKAEAIDELLASRTSPATEAVAPIGYATEHSLRQLAVPMTSSFDVRIYRKDHFPDKTDWPENLKPLYATPQPVAVKVTDEMVERACKEYPNGSGMRAALEAALSSGDAS